MGALTNQVLSPRDCILIIGLPLEKNAFTASLRCENTYARSYLDEPDDVDWAWQKASERFVEPCRQSISRVEALGGKVATSVSPNDFAAATASFAVIAIFTHSIWQPFDVSHAKDPNSLTESLMFGSQMAAEVFRSWLVEFAVAGEDRVGEPISNEILGALAAASRFSHDWWAATPAERKAHDPRSLERAVADNLCRPEIDRQFADSVRFDKGIELGGEMYGVDEIFGRRAIPANRKCIFDLRICNSGMLMNSVKALHPESLVIVNQWHADPIFGLLRYTAILQDLKNRHCSYLSACERIQRAMADKHT